MRPPPRTAPTSRRAAKGPATVPRKVPAPAMTEERRRMLGISKSPGQAFTIGFAFWGAFGALFLGYLGIIG